MSAIVWQRYDIKQLSMIKVSPKNATKVTGHLLHVRVTQSIVPDQAEIFILHRLSNIYNIDVNK